MKKTLKILFPLLVIIGVLFAMLVPVSAFTAYSYDPEYDRFSKRSSNDTFYFEGFYGGSHDDFRTGISVVALESNSYTYLRCKSPSRSFDAFAVSFTFESSCFFQISTCVEHKKFTVLEYHPSDNSYSLFNDFYFELTGYRHSVTFVVDLFHRELFGYVDSHEHDFAFDLDDYNYDSVSSDWAFNCYIAWDTCNPPSTQFSLYDFFITDVFPYESYHDTLTSFVVLKDLYWSGYSGALNHAYMLESETYQAGFSAGEALHENDYEDGFSDGVSTGQEYGEALHANDYQNGVDAGYIAGYDEAVAVHENDYSSGYDAGKRNGEALHAADYENGYNAGIVADTNVVTDTVDGVFDGLLSTLGILNGFSIFGITLGGILSIAAIFLVLFFIFKVIRK